MHVAMYMHVHCILYTRGGWKELIKTACASINWPKFHWVSELCSLTQQFCTSFDGNEVEIDISGARNGVIWSVGHLSSVLEKRAFMDVS